MQLAAKVIDTEAKLRATLLHELCHVATWVLPPHVAKVISWLPTVCWRAIAPHDNHSAQTEVPCGKGHVPVSLQRAFLAPQLVGSLRGLQHPPSTWEAGPYDVM